MGALDFAVGSAPVERARVGSNLYRRQQMGLGMDPRDYSRTIVTPGVVGSVARAYERLPSFDPKAIPAYEAMREEVKRQYDHMITPESKGGMGMKHEVTDHDPYTNLLHGGTADFFNDVREGRIKSFATASTGGHPFFSNDENDMFRAVHDVFGHAGSGRGVDRHGEEAAFQKHSAMFSPLARLALATETRGQNHSLLTNGEYPEQKVALLPKEMTQASFTNQGSSEARARALLQAQQFQRNQGIAS